MSTPLTTTLPGLVVVWSGAWPALHVHALDSVGVVLGRELLGAQCPDDRISRRHARVRHEGGQLIISDLGSRNGTYVNGHPVINAEVTATVGSVIRTGRTVAILVGDVRVYQTMRLHQTATGVIGPFHATAAVQLVDLARRGAHVHVLGEPGVGRGDLLERYVQARRLPAFELLDDLRRLPTTPHTLIIPRLEFARGPFLAELTARLPTLTGSSLVAASEIPISELAFVPTETRAAFATTVQLPPLWARPAEIAHLIGWARHHGAARVEPHATFIEACLLRRWPGNDLELLETARGLLLRAADAGRTDIRAEDLELDVGQRQDGAPTVNQTQRDTLPASLRRS